MSKSYLITYDLNKDGQNYDDIIKTIKDDIAGYWCTYWKSSFLITSSYTPQQMLNKLKPYLDSNDRMLIVEVVNNKSGWLTQKQWDWINSHIF